MVKYIIQPKSLAEKLLRLNIKNTIPTKHSKRDKYNINHILYRRIMFSL